MCYEKLPKLSVYYKNTISQNVLQIVRKSSWKQINKTSHMKNFVQVIEATFTIHNTQETSS